MWIIDITWSILILSGDDLKLKIDPLFLKELFL